MGIGQRIIVEMNNLRFDSGDPRCQIIMGETQATANLYLTNTIRIAFLTVIETQTQTLKRYWGVYDYLREKESVEEILKHGGKWPMAFREFKVPPGEKLYEAS